MRQLSGVCFAVVLAVSADAAAQSITRGPYLQLATPTSMRVVFRTSTAGVGRVRYGTSPTALTQSVTGVSATEHVLNLTGLMPATRYWYAVDLDGAALASGDAYRFRTYPTPGTIEGFRIFAWGDSGNGSAGQFRVANRMATEIGDATFSMILGDIIYPDGEPQNYDPEFFVPYAQLLERMVIWPVIGNHDIHLFPNGQPWLDAFHTPANNPAGSELYYSFDYANAHVVVLDTHVNSYSAGSAQMQWAAADLAASSATWKLAAFHVPPYTGGTHTDSASVQAGILPVLEAAGVDLVFAGHSHVYERTYLLKSGAIVQNNLTSYDKPTATTGTLYLVSGTAGQSGALSNPSHPLMAFQLGNVYGNSVVDIAGNSAHGYFLKDDGSAVDLFKLTKGTDTTRPRLVAARATSSTRVELAFDEPVAAGTGATGAERPGAYAIAPSVSVSAAALQSDQRTVVLTTGTHAPGSYTVTASGVADRAATPNVIGAGNVQPYSVGDGGASVPDAGPVDAGSPPDAGSGADGGLLFVGPITPLQWAVGTMAPPPAWKDFAFDDTLWDSGRQPIGYGEVGLQTVVSMGTAATLYTRYEFDLFVPSAAVQGLTLEIDFDDGFVAYLNGNEIARQGLAAGQSNTTLATSHEHGVPVVFPLPGAASYLMPGDNYLAIEVHNTALTSSDLYLNARLWANAIIIQSDAGMPPSDDDGGVDAGAGGGGGGGAGGSGGGTAGGTAGAGGSGGSGGAGGSGGGTAGGQAGGSSGGAGGGIATAGGSGGSGGTGGASGGGEVSTPGCGCSSSGEAVFALAGMLLARRYGRRRSFDGLR